MSQDGLDVISVRIFLNKEKADFSSLQFVEPEMWSKTGRVIGRTKETRQINEFLEKSRAFKVLSFIL